MRLKENRVNWSRTRRLVMLMVCALIAIGAGGTALAFGARAATAASVDTAKPKSVPAGEMAGNLIAKKVPVYPTEAKKARIQGKVTLRATIDKEGNVANLHVISGPKELQQSALDAVKEWKYKPYTVDGAPVEVETTVNVIYTLKK